MTLWTPPPRFTLYETNLSGRLVAQQVGTSVASGSVAHTKNGTYTQLIAATSFDAYWIEILFSEVSQSAVDTGILVDIAIGAAASETVIIPNLNAGHAAAMVAGTVSGGQRYAFPLYIPAGSRLSATAQGVQTSDTVRCAVWLRGGPIGPVWAGTQVVDYGTNLATSQGVAVTAGTTSEGAWTEIVAATTQDLFYLTAGVAGADSSVQSSLLALDVGIGTAAAEEAIGEEYLFSTSTSEELMQLTPIQIWRQIPSGTRLAARLQTSGTADALDAILYGVS